MAMPQPVKTSIATTHEYSHQDAATLEAGEYSGECHCGESVRVQRVLRHAQSRVSTQAQMHLSCHRERCVHRLPASSHGYIPRGHSSQQQSTLPLLRMGAKRGGSKWKRGHSAACPSTHALNQIIHRSHIGTLLRLDCQIHVVRCEVQAGGARGDGFERIALPQHIPERHSILQAWYGRLSRR